MIKLGQGGQISSLFHEGAQDVQLINLSILPRWMAGFQAAEAKLVSRAARFKAVSELLWSDKDGEVWFSSEKTT